MVNSERSSVVIDLDPSRADRTVSQRLADHVHDLRFDDIPAEVVDKAKDHLVHHVGLALQGHGSAGASQALRTVRRLSGGRAGECSVIGQRERASLLDAVFANSCLMTHDGLDDYELSGGHPGVITWPIALAVGESSHVSGREFLTAVVAGYDVMSTLGRAVWTWSAESPRRTNNVFAPFGGAATAARLLGLSREETAHALGHAGQAGMGLVEGPEYLSAINPLLARNGLMAAVLAASGMPVGSTMIEGRFGVFNAFFGFVPDSLGRLVGSIGNDFAMTRARLKRNLGSGLNIVPMEVAEQVVRTHRLTPERIVSVDVILPREREMRESAWEDGLLSPSASRTKRAGSLRFQVAVILVEGKICRERFEATPDDNLLALLGKVQLLFEDDRPLGYARVELTTTDGERFSIDADAHVLPRLEWDDWLATQRQPVLNRRRLQRLLEVLAHLEDVDDVAELTACLVPVDRRT